MIQLELGSRRWPLAAGETIIGSSPAAAVRLEHTGVLERHAIVQAAGAGAAIRRAEGDAVIAVNGVRMGGDPVPLLHGDKIQLGGVELVVVDNRQDGTTRLADASALRAATEPAPSAGSPPAATGGRLVSLGDGREYQIGQAPLVFGRDASCDVVIESTDVSRRHALLASRPEGYVLEDTSANGVLVNGERVAARRTLKRGDVISLGPAEFRFHAETTPTSGPDSAPPGAAHRLFDTVHGIPAMVPAFPSRPTAPPPLATVLVRTGSLKGQRLPIRTPVVNIGRADYNDLVFGEESVSAAHAKLQHREEVWVLTDLGSTNGTFVDGDQIHGEVPLMPGSTVRFGDVTMMFDPSDTRGRQPPGGGTRASGMTAIPDTPRMPGVRPPATQASRQNMQLRREPPAFPARALALLVAAAAIAAVAFYFFGR